MYQLKEFKKSLFWCLLLNCFIINIMKYNLENLPKSWGVWTNTAKNSSRWNEFVEIYKNELGDKNSYNVSFNAPYVGVVNGSRILSADENTFGVVLTITQFFSFIDPVKIEFEKPAIGVTDSSPIVEIGDYLICRVRVSIPAIMEIEVGDRLLINYVHKGGVRAEHLLISNEDISKYFTIEKSTTWTPEKGSLCFVKNKNFRDYFYTPYIFIAEYEGKYICVDKDSKELVGFYEKIKPYEPAIPYLKEIEELIKKSNEESEFSVITYNVEKK